MPWNLCISLHNATSPFNHTAAFRRAGEKPSLPRKSCQKGGLSRFIQDRCYLESRGFSAHALDKFILISTLYYIQSVDVLGWSNQIICPVAQHTQAISHVHFHYYKKVPELSRERSSNNRGLWNLTFPSLYPLLAPTHKHSQEVQTPWGWGNNIAPGYPPSSSSYAWKSWCNTSECQKPCSLLWQTGQREENKQVSEHESSFQ